MPQPIYFVTTNALKFEIAQAALAKLGIVIEQLALDIPEIQSDSVEEVAKYSAKLAAEQTKKTVIKMDVGLSIDALHGFPGPFVKYINQWLTTNQFIRLYKDNPNKKAHFIDALAYCEPGQEPVCFIMNTPGRMIEQASGDDGWMTDSVFIQDGYNKTIAAMTKEESIKAWSIYNYEQLAKYLTDK
jgi:XTP/dITP diphosphohydrolase